MRKTILLISLFSFLYISCNPSSVGNYSYRIPENINDGFAVGNLADAGIDSTLIEQAVDSINRGRYDEVHSMLIFKDGKLVLDEYFDGHKFKYDDSAHHGDLLTWDKTMPHRVMSVTKSITSICIGIAVDKGFIESVNQSIFDYLPEYRHLGKDGKEKITIEHLLTMTSGLQWNEWALPYGNRNNDFVMLFYVDDPVEYYLNKPLLDEPGTSFNYAGGSNILLGEILRKASDMSLDEFSEKYLFGPLGIEPFYWARYANGMIDAASSVEITPRSMAKIGLTFLNKGVWQGKRIVSGDWVDKSAVSYPVNNSMSNLGDNYGMRGYSYSWWTHSFVKSSKSIDMFYAEGWGGQFIMVIPDLNTVVVFTGGNYTSFGPPFEILKNYILPAIN